MANFKSQAYIGGVKFRPVAENLFEVSATVKIPAGRALVSGDTLSFLKIGEYVDIRAAYLRVTGGVGLYDGAAGTWQLGTDLDPDNFVAAAVLGQSATDFSVQYGPTGGTAFATASPPTAASRSIIMTQNAAVGVQTLAAAADPYVTLTALLAPYHTGIASNVPYEYTDRYTNAGVSPGLVDNPS